jgi:hypothetical protein
MLPSKPQLSFGGFLEEKAHSASLPSRSTASFGDHLPGFVRRHLVSARNLVGAIQILPPLLIGRATLA